MDDAIKLTKAQAKTLRAILSQGGADGVELHMGRLSKRWPFRKTTVRALARAGLVEAVMVRDPRRTIYPENPNSERFFVSAAGCKALNAFDVEHY